MAWYNPFTWGEKATDNILDKDNGLLTQVGSWVGGMDFTEEEQAEMNNEIRKGVVDYAKATMNENTQRSKARRDIAKAWIFVHLSLVVATAFCAPFDIELAKFLFSLCTSNAMFGGTVAVMTFYFGSYLLARNNETKKDN